MIGLLRTTLWLLVAMEGATALIVSLIPVAPENDALAGNIVLQCLGAAAIALVFLAVLRWFERRSNG